MWRIVAGIVAAAVVCQEAHAVDDDIVFAPKAFINMGEAFVGMSGTLTGEGVPYKNNSHVISCERELKYCVVSHTEQIGDKQIARLEYPTLYRITKWDTEEVVATDNNGVGCSRTTIVLARKKETALWVEEPINQTKTECANSSPIVRKWTIENSLGWKKMWGR
jgi:hypothetical protein